MTEHLVPFAGGLARREFRERTRMDAGTRLELARIEQQADLQAARAQAVGYVGKRAMSELSLLTQVEIQLSTLTPMATARLQVLGDLCAIAMADVVADTARKVVR